MGKVKDDNFIIWSPNTVIPVFHSAVLRRPKNVLRLFDSRNINIKVKALIFFILFQLLFFSESLVEAIHSDIREAEQALEKPENQAFLSHNFFSKTDSDNASGCT